MAALPLCRDDGQSYDMLPDLKKSEWCFCEPHISALEDTNRNDFNIFCLPENLP